MMVVIYTSLFLTYMLEEDAELRVGLWVNGGLEHRKEDVLQHLAKVGHKVLASEDVTEILKSEKKRKTQYQPIHM